MSELEKVAHQPYQLLYINTGYSYWSNSPGIWWLWHTYRSLPPQCREQLQQCYVLHCDWALRLASSALYPLLAGDLWKKVEFVPRAEFLPPGLQVTDGAGGQERDAHSAILIGCSTLGWLLHHAYTCFPGLRPRVKVNIGDRGRC